MLYFKDPAGNTAWALPRYIDQECYKRDYLKYGRLNIMCFKQVWLTKDFTYFSSKRKKV